MLSWGRASTKVSISLLSQTTPFEVNLASPNSGLEKTDLPGRRLHDKISSLFPNLYMSGKWELEEWSWMLLHLYVGLFWNEAIMLKY